METIEKKLHNKQIKKPNAFLYNFLGYFWKYTFARKYHLKTTYIDDPRKEKGSYILISNHASRMDYIFTAIPLLPDTLNFVAGYNEFFRSHLHGIFSLMQVIPKQNFTPDIYAVMQMKRVLNKGGRLCLFPEGMSSISGGSQPVALGSAKFLKMAKVPVYISNIKGAYLVSPKFNLKERKGRVEVSIKRLFSVNDLEKLTEDEIANILNKEIHTDDYAFNKTAKIRFESDSIAKNIEQLLYKCPKCGSEFLNVSGNDYIKCGHCGNLVKVDNYYNLIPFNDSKCFSTPKEWFDWERSSVKEEIKDPNFELMDEVEIGFLPKYEYLKNQKTSNIEGKGTLKINHNGIFFEGVRNNEKFSFALTLKETPTYGMCTDASRFYTFIKGEFIEFYPKRNSVIKWLLVTEELHRMHGGKRKDYDYNE